MLRTLLVAALFTPVTLFAHKVEGDALKAGTTCSGTDPCGGVCAKGACLSCSGKPCACIISGSCTSPNTLLSLSRDLLGYAALPDDEPFRCGKGSELVRYKDGYKCRSK